MVAAAVAVPVVTAGVVVTEVYFGRRHSRGGGGDGVGGGSSSVVVVVVLGLQQRGLYRYLQYLQRASLHGNRGASSCNSVGSSRRFVDTMSVASKLAALFLVVAVVLRLVVDSSLVDCTARSR